MNKIILTLAFIISTQLSLGQSVLDKYDDQAGISSIIVTNKMFELMSKINNNTTDAELQKYNKLLKKLDNLKVFMTVNSKITADMKATAAQYLKTANLEELMRMTKDDGKNIKIFVKESSTNPDFIKELFMFIEGGTKENQSIIFSLTGDFDLNEISTLTDKMNLPGGDALKKAKKK